MTEKSPEPNVYMPKKGESVDPMLKALNNIMQTDEERIANQKRVDKGRVSFPKKAKKKEETKVE